MNIWENLWIVTSIAIIVLILATDPKSSIRGGNELAVLFSSASDNQKFIKNLTWTFIAVFYVLTLAIAF